MKTVTLTFDNGPTPGITERVLAILRKHGLKATFMVIGNNLTHATGQNLLAEIAADGHWIGNHSLTHSVAFGDKLEPGYADYEISRTQELIGSHARPEKYFRPFGNDGLLGPHLLSEEALNHLKDHAYTCVLWNSIPRDWNDPQGWVQRGLDQVKEQDWSVVVLHDIEGACVDRLDEFITQLKDMKVHFEQAMPESVMPIQRGRVVSLPGNYVRSSDAHYFRDRGFAGRMGFGKRPALLIIDVMNGFTDPTMPLGAPADEQIIQINRLLDATHERNVPVFLTAIQYDHPMLADAGLWPAKIECLDSLMANSRAVEQDARLHIRETDALVIKKYASSFFGTDLSSRLTSMQVDTVVITGMTTSGCVRASAVDACQYGFRPMVVTDAVADRSASAHAQALVDIETKYGDTVSTDVVLEYLSKAAFV